MRPSASESARTKDTGTQFKKQPLRFEINRGQTSPEVRFTAQQNDSTLFLTSTEAVLRLRRPEFARKRAIDPNAADVGRTNDPLESAVIRIRPVRSNSSAPVTGLDRLPGVSNFLIGNDPRKWCTNVESFARVKYENVYPGIDLIYYGNEEGRLEYDFNVAPGADPGLIAMSVEGADKIEMDASGGLILSTSAGPIRQHPPRIYQEVNGTRVEIAGSYKLFDGEGVSGNTVAAFRLGDYDATRELVIDPQLVYATYLGGGQREVARGITVDAAGNAYITGESQSSDFPTRNPLDATGPASGDSKAFVTKFAPDGSLIYSTFLGGASGFSSGAAIAVDSSGAVYLTGLTSYRDFPTKNAFQQTYGGGDTDGFVTKLRPDGASIVYSTFLGGNKVDDPTDIKLDASKEAYVVGNIEGQGDPQTTFPTMNPTQAAYGGGESDGFFSVIDSNGSSLIFSTFLETGQPSPFKQSGDDLIRAVGVDPATGDAYLTGRVRVQQNGEIVGRPFVVAFRSSIASLHKLKPSFFPFLIFDYYNKPIGIEGSGFFFSGKILINFFLGLSRDVGKSGAAGAKALIVESPVTVFALAQGTCLGPAAGGGCVEHALSASFDRDLKLQSATNIAGSQNYFVDAATQGPEGAVYILGDTNSANLQTVSPIQGTLSGQDDAVIAVYAPQTLAPAFVTYLGGRGSENPRGIAVDPQGNIYVTGFALQSPDFPTTPGAFQRELKGEGDAFIAKISPVSIPTAPDFTLAFDSPRVTGSLGSKATLTLNINRVGGLTGPITITPPEDLPKKVKMPTDPFSTTDSSVTFKAKIKGAAKPGEYPLTFTGRDSSGKQRSATVTLIIQ